MSKKYLKKIMALGIIATCLITLNPIGASAEWKQDSTGWWYTEGNSWATGWREIDGKWYYFDNDGYMKTGWIQDENKWYYLDSDGAMLKNTTINGYALGSDGAWVQNTQNNSEESASTQNTLSNVNRDATTISGVTGIKSSDITKIVFYDGRGGINKPVTVEDKEKIKEFMEGLDRVIVKKTKNPKIDGWAQEAIFYINDKEVINIVFGDPIEINNDYFKIVNGSLDTDKIDAFLKPIDSSHLTTDEINEAAKIC